MRQKQVFKTTLLILAVLLICLPFIVTFNDILTRIIQSLSWYAWIQDRIVPFEVRMVRILTGFVGISFKAYQNGMMMKGVFLEMSWNCVGWQSLILFLITLVVGLRSGTYTTLSMLEATALGLLSIFWVNLLRLVFIIILFAYAPPLYTIVYHDYLAALVTVLFLVIFWHFAYKYILLEVPQANLPSN